jgi:hypothetical protein
MIRRAALVLLFSFASWASLADEKALVPYVWNDVTGTRDMPWMGSGGRARLFKRDVTKPWDVMNPRGPTIETSWGSRGGSGEPFLTAGDRVTAYLASTGFLKPWPAYPVSPGGQPKAAFPYRVTIVCLEPTVAILRFDLSAAIEDPIEFSFGAFPTSLRETGYDQHASGSGLANPVMFGTRLVYGATLLWFSPDAAVPPTPLVLSGGRARIVVKGVTLELERRGEEIVVVRR